MVAKRKKATRRWLERRSQGRSTPLFEGSSNTQRYFRCLERKNTDQKEEDTTGWRSSDNKEKK
jgi:hypothetical protein